MSQSGFQTPDMGEELSQAGSCLFTENKQFSYLEERMTQGPGGSFPSMTE
jgi:hypothetical protein